MSWPSSSHIAFLGHEGSCASINISSVAGFSYTAVVRLFCVYHSTPETYLQLTVRQWHAYCTSFQAARVLSHHLTKSVFFAGYTQVLPPVLPGPADHLPNIGSHICALPFISKERSPAAHVISAQLSGASAAGQRGVHQSHGLCAPEEAAHTCV